MFMINIRTQRNQFVEGKYCVQKNQLAVRNQFLITALSYKLSMHKLNMNMMKSYFMQLIKLNKGILCSFRSNFTGFFFRSKQASK